MSEVRLIDVDPLNYGKCRGSMVGGILFAELNDITNVNERTRKETPAASGSTGSSSALPEAGGVIRFQSHNSLMSTYAQSTQK